MSKILKGLTEANSVYGHSDPAREYGADDPVYTKRSRYPQDDTFDDDVAYSRKMYQLGQQQKAAKEKAQRDADHDRLASGTNEEQLDELSNEKLGQYKTAAARDASKADSEGDYKRGNKRFSGINKATNKQFANDTKNPVKEDINVVYAKAKALIKQLDESMQQKVIDILKKSVDDEEQQAFKNVNNRVNNPKILGTTNKAKSAYYPPAKPLVKKLDKPLPESLGDNLPSKSLQALMQAKQQNEKQRMADLEQWEKDFKQNTVSKFTAREPNFRQRATSTSMVAMPGEKHSQLKARLSQLDKAIEKQGILDKLVEKLEDKGLMTPTIEAIVDTSLLVKDGASDNYIGLNDKLDTAVKYVMGRLGTNKAAYAKPKGVDEGWSQKYKSSINCSHPKGFSQKAHCAGKKKHNESIEMEMVCEDCGMCETHGDHTNLDEACWKGYHKEGNKKMFGKTYPNCVKNEGVVEDDAGDVEQRMINKIAKYKEHLAHLKKTDPAAYKREMEKHKQTNRIPPVSTFEGHSESCPHCGGEMVSEELMNEKKDACYYKVKSRYKVWPSAYASGALVKCRNKGASNWGNGGKKNEGSILEGINRADESLHDWFNKEKWVRMDTKGKIKGPCAREPGEGKPKCLPQSKAHSLGKKGRASAAQRKRREDPNPERSGKAINVNTKKSKG